MRWGSDMLRELTTTGGGGGGGNELDADNFTRGRVRYCGTHLYPGFDKVEPGGERLPHEDVRVVWGLERLLQLLQLPAVEVGPRPPPLLLLVLLLLLLATPPARRAAVLCAAAPVLLRRPVDGGQAWKREKAIHHRLLKGSNRYQLHRNHSFFP